MAFQAKRDVVWNIHIALTAGFEIPRRLAFQLGGNHFQNPLNIREASLHGGTIT